MSEQTRIEITGNLIVHQTSPYQPIVHTSKQANREEHFDKVIALIDEKEANEAAWVASVFNLEDYARRYDAWRESQREAAA